jgi:nucleotide-binding universal stress UspA family protein
MILKQRKMAPFMTQEMLPNSACGPCSTTQKGVQAVPEEDDLVYRRILVPIDFSEHSSKTVAFATRFASPYKATLQLLHVFEIPDYAATPYGRREQTCNLIKSQLDAAEQDARENLMAFENQLRKLGFKVEAYLRVGYPFDEIVQMAKHLDVDLIIIGSHGYTGITRLLVGSTAERVVERAPCPVLVVKERPLKPKI